MDYGCIELEEDAMTEFELFELSLKKVFFFFVLFVDLVRVSISVAGVYLVVSGDEDLVVDSREKSTIGSCVFDLLSCCLLCWHHVTTLATCSRWWCSSLLLVMTRCVVDVLEDFSNTRKVSLILQTIHLHIHTCSSRHALV